MGHEQKLAETFDFYLCRSKRQLLEMLEKRMSLSIKIATFFEIQKTGNKRDRS